MELGESKPGETNKVSSDSRTAPWSRALSHHSPCGKWLELYFALSEQKMSDMEIGDVKTVENLLWGRDCGFLMHACFADWYLCPKNTER